MLHSPSRRPAGIALPLSAGRLSMALALVLGLLVVGCASRKQMEMLSADTARISVRLDSLQTGQQVLMDSVVAIQRQIYDLKAGSEYGSSALREKIETLAARLEEIVTRMDRSMAPLEEFLRKQPSADTSKAAALGVDYFDAAQRDLVAGNYDLAEVGFLQFIETYPKSDLADDARYGLAETYYWRKRWDEAIDEYKRVVNLNPQGTKTPAAMLKIGLCHQAKNDNRAARKSWEELVKKFPFSDEAKIAAQRLDEIKGKK